MLGSRLFWKIFLIYALILVALAGVFISFVVTPLRRSTEEQADDRLRESAVVLRHSLVGSFPKEPSEVLQQQLHSLQASVGVRFTVISDDGTVIGDSETLPSNMDNHSDREEIQLARTTDEGEGHSQRYSESTGRSMLYAAVRVGEKGDPAGFIRTAIPLESVNADIIAIQRRTAAFTAAAAALGFVIAYIAASRLVAPITSLAVAATSVSKGNLATKVPVIANDEFGQLAATFNAMSRELVSRNEEVQLRCRRLEEDNDRLSTVFGSMIEGVVAVDERHRILFANNAAQSLLDLAGPMDIGRPIWEAIRHATIQQVVNDTLSGKDRTVLELEIPRKHAVVAMLATRLPGKPCPGVVLVLHDVTDLRRLENLRREFVSNVSHELKTPLTAIQAYTETLLSGALEEPEHSRQFVERIEEHADRLHALILDLLRLARIESGTDVFDVQAIPLREAVEFCLDEHRPVAQAKSIAIEVEGSEEPLRVKADDEGLHTILSNLVDNAIKYTPSGGRVIVRWRKEGAGAAIQVEDTGSGIPVEHQARIFERFYRVDKARSRELGGTGLGLSIVKHLTNVFAGSIEVKSQPGRGSIFTVRLPLA